jgi:amidase
MCPGAKPLNWLEDGEMKLSEYDELDGVALAGLVSKREVSPLDLVEEAIARIESRNPSLNAVVYKMYDHAREIAKRRLPEAVFAGCRFWSKT